MVAPTLYRRTPTAPLLEADAPLWAHRFAQRLNEFFKLRHPQAPSELLIVKFLDLPPAADWQGAQVYVIDKGKVAVSSGAAWVTTDGGPL